MECAKDINCHKDLGFSGLSIHEHLKFYAGKHQFVLHMCRMDNEPENSCEKEVFCSSDEAQGICTSTRNWQCAV